jgi:hypothetical protein
MINDFEIETDLTFPGENWFFYWKSSPSLWKSKLQSYKGVSPVFIPINWSYHSDTGDQYDFSEYKPETNLAKIYQIAEELGIELIYLIPLSPVPYLSNGGIPPLLARTMSLSKKGIAQALINSEGRINKLFSFYDPRVFQAYRKFIWALQNYFEKNNIHSDIYGMNCGYTQSYKFRSYMEDTSKAFESGFSKFLSASQNDQVKNNSPKQELLLKEEYGVMINELYSESAKETFLNRWGGVLNISFLGGIPSDFVFRSFEFQEHSSDYFGNMMEVISSDFIPSSVLISQSLKKGIFNKALKNLISPSFIEHKLNSNYYEDQNIYEFSPLIFFDIVCINKNLFPRSLTCWESLGLIDYLEENYKSNFRIRSGFNEELILKSEEEQNNCYFFSGHDLTYESFKNILRLFMNGCSIIIDKNAISENVNMKMEAFIFENNLKNEKINFISPITYTTLGTGKLIVFDGQKIMDVPVLKRHSFFKNVLDHLNISNIKTESDKDIYLVWEIRSPTTNELKFEQIRRASIYNPTSYKKKIKLFISKRFALLKVVDQVKCNIQQQPMSIAVECLPGGSVYLDFGHFES